MSVVHVVKGDCTLERLLDGCRVETISAYLFHAGGHEDPSRLAANAGKSFQGSIVLGMGFTFDDADGKDVATPVAERQRLIDERPQNGDVIFPYIGGDEVNTSPTHTHHRYVINFGELGEAECRLRWPELMAIVEEKVRPERLAQNDAGAKERWWQFIRPRPELQAAIGDYDHILAMPRVSQHLGVVRLPANMVFSEQLVVFPYDMYAAFCGLQARPHEVWARFFASSLEDRLRYTPSDCFETFPFPDGWEADSALEAAGESYYVHRAALMVANDEGLTKTYNRFHDPYEHDSGIEKLRDLHAKMDRAVLKAYGWEDISTECEFVLDYEIDEEEWGTKRKPYRHRWPDEIRDEVLARLIALNAERAAEEQRTGAAAGKRDGTAGRRVMISAQMEALL